MQQDSTRISTCRYFKHDIKHFDSDMSVAVGGSCCGRLNTKLLVETGPKMEVTFSGKKDALQAAIAQFGNKWISSSRATA